MSRITILSVASTLGACTTAEPLSRNQGPFAQEPTFIRVADGSLDSREAGMVGQLVQDGPCLRVLAGRESYLIIWPPSSSARTVAGKFEIVDQRTGGVAVLGDRVSVVGGIETLDGLERVTLSNSIPGECQGPYWLAGSIREE